MFVFLRLPRGPANSRLIIAEEPAAGATNYLAALPFLNRWAAEFSPEQHVTSVGSSSDLPVGAVGGQ
jgi:hypothetical protein